LGLPVESVVDVEGVTVPENPVESATQKWSKFKFRPFTVQGQAGLALLDGRCRTDPMPKRNPMSVHYNGDEEIQTAGNGLIRVGQRRVDNGSGSI
jgi:hypothetical protein